MQLVHHNLNMSLLFSKTYLKLFLPQLLKSHRKEFFIILQGGLIRAYNLTISLTFSRTLIMFIVFTAFTATGGTLTPRRVFTTLSLVVFMRKSMLFIFVRGIFQLSESRVGDDRIQVRHFLCGRLAYSDAVPSSRECVLAC